MSSRAIHFLPFLTPCTRPSSFPFPPLALNPHSAQPLPALAGRTNLASALRARLGSASSSAAPSSSSSTSGSRSHDTSYGLNHLQRKRPSSPFAASRAFTTAAQLAQQIGNANPAEMGAIATGRVDTTARVQKLREALKQEKLDAYVIPSEDSHASEYPAESDLRRGFITGFTGSAGCAVVTLKDASLFTDGRYFLQAGQQLEPKVWTLMKQGEPNVPTWQEYLYQNIAPKSRIGIDGSLITADDAQDISAELNKVGSQLVPLEHNLVDAIWSDRPARPHEPVFVLGEEYAGRSVSDKIRELRDELKKKSVRGFVANMLDEVAWLFNLRGSDVPYNPVFFGYALVLMDRTLLYVEEKQLSEGVRKHLGSDVELRPYDALLDDLRAEGAKLGDGQKILIGKKASLAIHQALGGKSKVKIDRSIVGDQKSIKNETELEGFRQSHIRDGAALAKYFAWLEERLAAGDKVSEAEGADKLTEFRTQAEMFRGLSFTTISSTGPNGAIIHYSPDPASCPAIDRDQIYLCDSGGQFTDGTTDVTRTWHFSQPSKDQIRAFTRVLQGHIAIDRAVFPKGTTGYLLDVLARRALWEDGLDYRHGTGHGVGHFLNVHEGPQGIGTRTVFNETSLKDGMVISNEPGYYQDGEWGIRIENLVVVRRAKTPNNFGDKGYLCFERLTMCPIQVSLVDASLLTVAEREWLNEYHDEVLAKVAPLLERDGDRRAVEWLKRQCSARV